MRGLRGFEGVHARFLLAPERPEGRSPDNLGAMIITAPCKSHFQNSFTLFIPTEGLITCHSGAPKSTVSKVLSDKDNGEPCHIGDKAQGQIPQEELEAGIIFENRDLFEFRIHLQWSWLHVLADSELCWLGQHRPVLAIRRISTVCTQLSRTARGGGNDQG